MIKVGIVDDHKIFLDSLEYFIQGLDDMEVVLTASSGEELIRISKNKPDLDVQVLLLDQKMQSISGLECLDYLTREHEDWKVIMLSMYNDSPLIQEAFSRGVKSFINKASPPEELMMAIRKVNKGELYIYPELANVLVRNIGKKQSSSLISHPKDFITDSEFEILQLICQGLTAQEMGDILHRSKRTIEGHRQHLLEKTDCKNVAALVTWAFREGLMQ